MALFKTITLTDGLIGVWALTESTVDLSLLVAPEELLNPELQKYSYEKRQAEWLATRILIKLLIGPDFTISYTNSGKPILNHAAYKHISISHSREFVAVFIHKEFNLGLDIENTGRNYRSIEKRYLSEIELTEVNGNPKLQCIYWCAKEAIFKLVPEQEIEFRKQIIISPFNSETEKEFTATFIHAEKHIDFTLYFDCFSDQCLVWVADSKLNR